MASQNNQPVYVKLPVDVIDNGTTKGVNLYHLIEYYLKHWVWIVALSVTGLVVGLVYTYYIQTPLYKSDATLAIVLPSIASSTDTTLRNYVELFKSRRVLDPVISKLKINESYDQFASTFDVSNDKSTDIIQVSVVSSDPKQGNTIATNTISSFENEVKSIYNADNVRIVDGASQPGKPYNVNVLMQLVIASAAGFIISVIGLFFAYDLKQSRSSLILAEANDDTEAGIAKRADKKEARKKQAENNARRKKEIEKLRSEKAEFKKLARESKQAKHIADKKAAVRRKNIAKKARIEKITTQNNLKKKARLVRIAERKDVRKIMRTNIALGIKSALFPLKKKIGEAKAVQALKYEARQAERIARHEERMAKIEDMRASSLEKRIAAISRSTKLAVRIEKDKKVVATKNNGNVFYAKIKANRLNRQDQPYELPGIITKTKHNLLNRIRRNRSK